jgi:hypothetical protein
MTFLRPEPVGAVRMAASGGFSAARLGRNALPAAERWGATPVGIGRRALMARASPFFFFGVWEHGLFAR